jgi:hypothetical protein
MIEHEYNMTSFITDVDSTFGFPTILIVCVGLLGIYAQTRNINIVMVLGIVTSLFSIVFDINNTHYIPIIVIGLTIIHIFINTNILFYISNNLYIHTDTIKPNFITKILLILGLAKIKEQNHDRDKS